MFAARDGILDPEEGFSWQPQDRAELDAVDLILAADIIYDNDLTEEFMCCMERFLKARQGRKGEEHYVRVSGHFNNPCDRHSGVPIILVCLTLLKRMHVCPPCNSELYRNVISFRLIIFHSKHVTRKTDTYIGLPKTVAGPPLRVLVAVEKRINFSLRSMCPTADAYDYWRSLFTAESSCNSDGQTTSACNAQAYALQGRQIPMDTIVQQFNYIRGTDLELWDIRLRSRS